MISTISIPARLADALTQRTKSVSSEQLPLTAEPTRVDGGSHGLAVAFWFVIRSAA